MSEPPQTTQTTVDELLEILWEMRTKREGSPNAFYLLADRAFVLADKLAALSVGAVPQAYDSEKEARTLFCGLLQPDAPHDKLAMAMAFLRLWANSYLLKGNYWDVPETMGNALNQVIHILCASIAELEAIIEALPAADEGWRSIETAPKDGTSVLVVSKMHSREPVVVMATMSKHGEWLSVPGRYSVKPTFWSRVPAPPDRSGETL